MHHRPLARNGGIFSDRARHKRPARSARRARAGRLQVETLESRVVLSVVISEFQASNNTTLADEESDFEDWIELRNTGPDLVDLDGWFLTDDETNLTKWRISDRAVLTGKAPPTTGEDVTYDKIDVVGNPAANGLYDSSVEYGLDEEVGWMVYSALQDGDRDFTALIDSTLLAKSTDQGETWTYEKVISRGGEATIDTVEGPLDGVWKYEVPTLLHDPGDEGREWKLFTHKVFWSEEAGKNLPMFGWITYRYAARPDGQWSPETALFGAGDFPPAPFDVTEYNLNDISPDLSDAVAYSEPGSLVRDDVLYLSLTAHQQDRTRQIILLASHDHGSTWEYMGVLLNEDDAAELGYDHFDGSSLVEVDGAAFLIATPGTEHTAYLGANVYEFEDISAARLKRDQYGQPVYRRIVPQQAFLNRAGAGQGTYHPHNANSGIIISQKDDREPPEVLRTFDTKLKIESGADVTLAEDESLIIFASAKDSNHPDSNLVGLHTNFRIAARGEFLALMEPDGTTIASQFDSFPRQQADQSYGVKATETFPLVDVEQPTTATVPLDDSLGLAWTEVGFDDSNWQRGTTAIGYERLASGFFVRDDFDRELGADFRVDIPAGGTSVFIVDEGQFKVAVPAQQDSFGDRGLAPLIVRDAPQYRSDYEMVTHISLDNGSGAAGLVVTDGNTGAPAFSVQWKRVSGSLGLIQTVAGEDVLDTQVQFDTTDVFLRLSRDALADTWTTAFKTGGNDEWETLHTAVEGVSGVPQISAAEIGLIARTDTDDGLIAAFDFFELNVGDENAFYRQQTGLDVEESMFSINASIYARIPFSVEGKPERIENLTMTIAYDDGFIAYLNGQEVARRSAPIQPSWDSAATGSRGTVPIATDVIDLSTHAGLLTAGNNVLAIHGMNVSAADDDFYLMPTLSAGEPAPESPQTFLVPTPGTENTLPVMGDATLDGIVDAADLNRVGVNWLRTDNAGWSNGDFTGDGSVDVQDLNQIGINWHPVAIPGDFNTDRIVDAADINLLFAAIQSGNPGVKFDLNNDLAVHGDDVRYLVEEIIGTFMGDANLDGRVDAADLNQVGIHWRQPGAADWSRGDFTGDGVVDASDLNRMGIHWLRGDTGTPALRLPRPPLAVRSVPTAIVDRAVHQLTREGLISFPIAPDTVDADVKSDLATRRAQYDAIFSRYESAVHAQFIGTPAIQEWNLVDDLIAEF